MEISCEMQIQIFHGNYLRAAAPCRPSLNAEARTQRRLSQGYHRLFPQLIKGLPQTDAYGSLALSRRCVISSFSATMVIGSNTASCAISISDFIKKYPFCPNYLRSISAPPEAVQTALGLYLLLQKLFKLLRTHQNLSGFRAFFLTNHTIFTKLIHNSCRPVKTDL